MTAPSRSTEDVWQPLDPRVAAHVVDARLEIHHAAQLVAAIGISYLPARADDSHTNLEWVPTIGALASRAVQAAKPFRLAVRPHPFALLAIDGDTPDATLELGGATVDDAARWVQHQLSARGIDALTYSLAKHYTIPPRRPAADAPFDAQPSRDFQEIGRWLAAGSIVLGALARRSPNASEVRCWPDHFDLATLLTVAPGRTVGVGMEPGDGYYAEPYFYVNAHPAPNAGAALPLLAGGGQWHTHEWTGAVLPASSVNPAEQRTQITAFIDSAVAACTRLLA